MMTVKVDSAHAKTYFVRTPPRRPVYAGLTRFFLLSPGWNVPRVAVFIDWQNAYMSARRAFGLTTAPSERGVFSPTALGIALAEGNGRGSEGRLCKVEIYRGLPSPKYDSVGNAACQRQAAAWQKESATTHPRLRPLRYPSDYPKKPPVEKGVDVQLALGLLECVLSGGCDLAVMVTNDTDMVPVIETIARLRGSEVIETAAWCAGEWSPRLRPKQPSWHHRLDRTMFDAVETPINYARAG